MKTILLCRRVCPRTLKIAIVLLFSPLYFFGQTLTGLWTGTLHNDSATVRKDQLFEIVLTEYKGKVMGFSRSEFIVDDTLYYIVKRVKGTIEGDICQVEDEEIVSYNFKGKLDKGVKVTSTFRRNAKDSTWYLDGSWKTNATKKYYSISGKVNLQEEQDLSASKIFPHLEELKLASSVAFYNERNESAQVVRIAKPEKVKTEYSSTTDLQTTSPTLAIDVTKPGFQRAEVKPIPEEPVSTVYQEGIKKQEAETPRSDRKKIAVASVAVNPTESNKRIALNPIPDMTAVVTTLDRPKEELPRTETKEIPATSVGVSPTESNKSIALNPIPDMTAVVTALDRPKEELPRTETKNIPATSVVVNPTESNKSIALNPIPDMTAVVTAMDRPKEELPRTETKNIPATSVGVNPTESNKSIALNPIPDMTAVVNTLDRPKQELPRTETKNIPATSVGVNPTESNKSIALNPIPDMTAVVTTLDRPKEELPRTETKNIPAATVKVSSTESGKHRKVNTVPVSNEIPSGTKNASVQSEVSKNEKNTNPIIPGKSNNSTAIKTAPAPVPATAVTNATTNNSIRINPENQTGTKTTNSGTTATAIKPVTRPNPAVAATETGDMTPPVESPPVVKPPVRKPLEEIKALGATIGGRRTDFSQIVSFKSDSIEISLYDNGEIDGDTVSIYLNGQVVMSNQGLKASAIKKTIQITPGFEDFTLVLFAENLGKYPPNTGLLVVHDGDDVYNLRFSSDFQKNAGIIFRRSK